MFICINLLGRARGAVLLLSCPAFIYSLLPVFIAVDTLTDVEPSKYMCRPLNWGNKDEHEKFYLFLYVAYVNK